MQIKFKFIKIYKKYHFNKILQIKITLIRNQKKILKKNKNKLLKKNKFKLKKILIIHKLGMLKIKIKNFLDLKEKVNKNQKMNHKLKNQFRLKVI